MKNWIHSIKTGKCIHKSRNNIYVHENSKHRWIIFNERFIQSLMDKKNPKKMLIPYLKILILFQKMYPGTTCLLGLGAGSLVHHLLHPQFPLRVVEILPDMIEIAKKFFQLPQTPQLTIECSCANTYLEQTDEKFDHIIVDLGDRDGFPLALKNKAFIENIFAKLQSNGFLAFNISQFYDIGEFKRLIKEVFGDYPVVIEAGGNWILLVRKHHHKMSLIEILKQKAYLKNYIWHPYYGEIVFLHSAYAQKLHIILNHLKLK